MSKCETVLLDMLDDLKKHQRSKDFLLKLYVEKRLEASLNTYYNKLASSLRNLSNFNEENVLKKLTKGIKIHE